MIDLFKYASDHNISIQISPASIIPLCYNIKISRKHYTMCTSVTYEVIGDPDDMIEFVLDNLLYKLERYIRECKSIGANESEVIYYNDGKEIQE